MGKQINEREVVLEILMEITENGAYSHKILGDVLSKYQYLEKRERAFITRVVEGTLEHMIEIDYILNQISKTKVKKMKPVIRNLLRSSVYQLEETDESYSGEILMKGGYLFKDFWGDAVSRLYHFVRK